jgi:hypothetical protein
MSPVIWGRSEKSALSASLHAQTSAASTYVLMRSEMSKQSDLPQGSPRKDDLVENSVRGKAKPALNQLVSVRVEVEGTAERTE